MAAVDYTKDRALASELIRDFGQNATLGTRSKSGGDDWNPTQIEDSEAVKVVVLEYSERERAGTEISINDKKAIISTSGVTVPPETGSILTVGGVDHTIIRLMPFSPGGVVTHWEAQLRK